jgi:O-antigen ligase
VETYLGVYSHNNFVEIMASLGFIGFISYYSIYVYTLVELRKTQITKELRIFFISTIIALLVIEWFQVTYSYKAPMLMLALAASSILPKNNYDNIVENKL